MAFALICAALLVAVLAAVSRPLLSGSRLLPSRGQYDQAVYRDQLLEVERDLARGVLTPDEADAARLEIQRRLLLVADTPPVAVTEPGPAGSPRLAVAAALFVVLGAGGLYLRLGTPGLSDAPFSSRPAVESEAEPSLRETETPALTDMKRAAELLEQKLSADPSNAHGWVLYARTESILGDWNKAADAYKHAIDLDQKSAEVFGGYGEMLVMAANGVVSPAARDAFASALASDTGSAVARFYLALADAQGGDARKAVDAWVELAAGLPEGSAMREEIARRIVEAAKSGGIDAPPMPKGLAADAPTSGPTAEQMEQAAAMPPAERAKMIGGMIEQLAAKLADNPNDLEGWLRLARAYAVQGDNAKAVDCYDHAAALKPGDPGIKLRTAAALMAGLKPGDSLPPRAVALLNEVAAVAPDAPEVLWYLGVAAVRGGRVAEAQEKWTRLLASLPPGGEDEKMVRAALGELKRK